MPRNITVTFSDGTKHVYQNAPDNATPQQVADRAQKEFGKQVSSLDGGRKPVAPAKPAPNPSFGNSLLSSAKGVIGGIVEGVGAIPDLVTTGLNELGKFANPSGYTPMPTVSDAVQEYTPEVNSLAPGVRISANLLGGAMIPGPKKAPLARTTQRTAQASRQTASAAIKRARPASSIIAAGEREGVPVLTSDVRQPKTFIGKTTQAIGERIPITGTGPVRANQQTARVNAVENLVKEFGDASLAENAAAVSDDLLKTRGAMLDKLTAAKTSVINSVKGDVPSPLTTKAIDEGIAELEAVGTDAARTIIAKLKDWRSAVQGKDLKTMELIRKEMGDAFKGQDMASIRSTGEKALSRIYGPMREDMGNFIKVSGGDYTKWKSANDQLANMAGEIGGRAFKNVMNDAETTPEVVQRLIFSKNPSDLRRLYSNLSPVGRDKAQAALISKAAEKAINGDAVSPEVFASELRRLGANTSVFFDPAAKARLDGFVRLMRATQRASQAALSPPTGVQAVPYALGAGFTQLFGLFGGVSAAGGTGLLARAYESAAVRNMLVGLGKTKAGSKAEAAALQRLGIAFEAALAKHVNVGDVGRAINSPTTLPLAADPGEQQQQQQRDPLQP